MYMFSLLIILDKEPIDKFPVHLKWSGVSFENYRVPKRSLYERRVYEGLDEYGLGYEKPNLNTNATKLKMRRVDNKTEAPKIVKKNPFYV